MGVGSLGFVSIYTGDSFSAVFVISGRVELVITFSLTVSTGVISIWYSISRWQSLFEKLIRILFLIVDGLCIFLLFATRARNNRCSPAVFVVCKASILDFCIHFIDFKSSSNVSYKRNF